MSLICSKQLLSIFTIFALVPASVYSAFYSCSTKPWFHFFQSLLRRVPELTREFWLTGDRSKVIPFGEARRPPHTQADNRWTTPPSTKCLQIMIFVNFWMIFCVLYVAQYIGTRVVMFNPAVLLFTVRVLRITPLYRRHPAAHAYLHTVSITTQCFLFKAPNIISWQAVSSFWTFLFISYLFLFSWGRVVGRQILRLSFYLFFCFCFLSPFIFHFLH